MTLHNHIIEIWDEHLDQLTEEMQVCLQLIHPSFSYMSLLHHDAGVFGEGFVHNGYVV